MDDLERKNGRKASADPIEKMPALAQVMGLNL